MRGNKETKETIDSVRMLAEGQDIMTLKIVSKRPFKQSNEAHSTQHTAHSRKL